MNIWLMYKNGWNFNIEWNRALLQRSGNYLIHDCFNYCSEITMSSGNLWVNISWNLVYLFKTSFVIVCFVVTLSYYLLQSFSAVRQTYLLSLNLSFMFTRWSFPCFWTLEVYWRKKWYFVYLPHISLLPNLKVYHSGLAT